MKNVFKTTIVLLIVLTLTLTIVPGYSIQKAYADINNLDVYFDENEKVLYWDFYPGANDYDIFISDIYWSSLNEEGDGNSFYVDYSIDELYADGLLGLQNVYEIVVVANDSNGEAIAAWNGERYHSSNLGEITGIRFDEAETLLMWDPYPGATEYYVGIEDNWEWINGSAQEFDIYNYFENNEIKEGTYEVRIEAYNDDGVIAFGVTTYTYESFEILDINIRIYQDGYMTWDPISGVSEYEIHFDNSDKISYVRGTTVHLDSLIDEYIEEGYLDNRGKHNVYINAMTSKKIYHGSAIYTHYYKNRETDTIYRYYGDTRYETSLKVADACKEKMELDYFNSIILAYGKNYADALAGSYLSSVTNAPIILVDNTTVRIKAAQKYIKTNLRPGGTIYLLGGSAVVTENVKDGLNGYQFKRLGGADRYETNIRILNEGNKIYPELAGNIIVCSGTGFADSLSAAATGYPILLVKGTKLNDMQKEYLSSLKDDGIWFTIVGGTGAVSSHIEKELQNYASIIDRVGGLDRYETSKKFAEYSYGVGATSAVIAYGGTFPDGLCGGLLAKVMGGPLVLAANGKAKAAAEYVKYNGISYGAVLGGPALIDDGNAKAIFDVSPDTKILVK